MMLLISTLHNITYVIKELQNKYESRTNTKIFNKRLYVCYASGSVYFAMSLYPIFTNAIITKVLGHENIGSNWLFFLKWLVKDY